MEHFLVTPQYLMEHLKVYTKGTLGYKVEGLWTEVTKTESFSNTQTEVVMSCLSAQAFLLPGA